MGKKLLTIMLILTMVTGMLPIMGSVAVATETDKCHK